MGAVLAMGSTMVLAEAASISEAVTGGKAGLDLRYRYEYVDQDGIDKSAGASTLRTRINFATAPYRGFGAFVEADDVTVIGSERYNNATGLPSAKTQYPVVADPDGTEINQAWLSYAGLDATTLKFGRQRIIYDNARFIGNVGWRQNEQTYDGFSLSNSSLADPPSITPTSTT
ncbi:alginate export family protein [Halopseudomonas pachastrellae]|nr:alginate export family protein [Halopseudomonas pachastrellae]